MAKKAKVVQPKRSAKDVFSFLWHSLYQNQPCLENEQPWWLALIILVVSLFASTLGPLTVAYRSNANGIASSNAGDVALDVGLKEFASDIDQDNRLEVVDGQLYVSGKWNYVAKDSDIAANFTSFTDEEKKAAVENYTANAVYTHKSKDKDVKVLRVYTLDIDTLDNVNSDNESAFVNAFLTYAVRKNETSSSIDTSSETAAGTSENTSSGAASTAWTDSSSYILFTRNIINIVTYVPGATSPVSQIQGYLSELGTYNFASIALDADGKAITSSSQILSNFLGVLNRTYAPVKNSYAWMNLGIQMGINAIVLLVATLVVWLVARSRSSIIHLNFYQALKSVVFMSLTPSLITFGGSFIMSQYSTFIFMLIMAIRVMFATQRLMGSGNSSSDSQPVYKARS